MKLCPISDAQGVCIEKMASKCLLACFRQLTKNRSPIKIRTIPIGKSPHSKQIRKNIPAEKYPIAPTRSSFHAKISIINKESWSGCSD